MVKIYELGSALKSQLIKPSYGLSIDAHLEECMKWLARAHDATPDGGVAIRFSLVRGWESSYPETTGYIIPTFLDYHKLSGDSTYRDHAIRMAEWELSIQQKDGSFLGGPVAKDIGKLVFDTGQIILGLIAACRETGEEKFINAARKAGDWLAAQQDGDGAWRRHTYNSRPHTYHSRVAWPVLMLYKETGEEKYLRAGTRNIDWVLTNRQPNGWFRNAGFTEENNLSPYTHTIAYTVRGVLEAGMLLDRPDYIEPAIETSARLLEVMRSDCSFCGRYDSEWRGTRKFSCLTGNAQISIIFSKIYGLTGETGYLSSAIAINEYLRSRQAMTDADDNIRGGISGSYPLWGEYERLGYPNWASKFFADALILEKKYAGKQQNRE